mmetsp:Transcript_4436/g.11116  ORF Transcript_4436/g.11116 Transcript_4436/m.11116 type:complete len:291 (+) Transcript_4436:302-1174(+)
MDELGGCEGAVDHVGLGVALHSRGCVDCVPKEAVPRAPRPHHVCDHGPRVEPHADAQVALGRIVHIHRDRVGHLEGVDREARDACRVVPPLVGHKVGDGHIRIADSFNLVDLVLGGELVELRVESVQHVRHLRRVQLCRDVRETNNVGEEDGDAVLLLSLNLPARNKGLGDVLREDVKEHSLRGGLPLHLLLGAAPDGQRLHASHVHGLDAPIKLHKGGAFLGVLVPAVLHHHLDFWAAARGNARALLFGACGVGDCEEHLGGVLPNVGLFTREDFEQHDAEGVHVRLCG